MFVCFFSLMVSNLNSLATVLWEDFVSQLPPMKGLNDKKQVLIIKLLGKYFTCETFKCRIFSYKFNIWITYISIFKQKYSLLYTHTHKLWYIQANMQSLWNNFATIITISLVVCLYYVSILCSILISKQTIFWQFFNIIWNLLWNMKQN